MVIDYILDRKDGYGYDVKEFYDACMAYEEFDIARALDGGTEKDVKKALCDYVIYNDYPKSICKYINSENWLDDDYYESKKSARKSLKEGINDELIATSSDGETTLYLSDERQANHGKDPHYEFKLGENGYFTRYIRCDDIRCENVVLNWIKEFDLDISKSEISKIIKLHESKKSTRNSLKKYLVKGLDVDFVVDHLLSLEDLDDFDLINKLDDLWKVYKKSWNKFNKSLSDFWKVMKNIEKLDSFDKTCKEIIDAWYDDIEKIFYSDDNLENLKLNYGFEGNDIF